MSAPARIGLRSADPSYAPRLHAVIAAKREEGLWLTQKIVTDCVGYPLFRRCGQYAMVVLLDRVYDRQSEHRVAPADVVSAHQS